MALFTYYLSALASQLMSNLTVITLAQGFFTLALLFILLLGLQFDYYTLPKICACSGFRNIFSVITLVQKT